MKLRGVFVAVALLAAGAGAFVWYSRVRPLPVPVAPVAENVPVRVFGLGTIEARVSTRVGFEVADVLTEVLADHGDRVAAGTPIARLNTASQEARVARAEATLASAEAQQLRFAAVLERARVIAAQRATTAQRRRELANRGTTPLEQAEQAETEAAAAAADLRVAEADAAVARAVLAEARALLLTERTALAKHTLLAPFDALVIARTREPGTALNPGEAVFTLIDPASVWGLAFVDEGRAGAIAVGQPAVVRMRSRPDRAVAARVVRIGLESDRVTEERRVYVACEQCPDTVFLGEQAEVEIETGRLPRARIIPANAVEGFDGVHGTVWVVRDGALARERVRFAARLLDGRLALTDGLPAEIPVVTRIGSGFAVGRAVTVAAR